MSSIKKDIFVSKRNGKKEQYDCEKIHKVLFWATQGLKGVSVSDIEVNAHLQISDEISTSAIHKVLIQSAVDLISPKNSNYQYVASRLLNYFLRKEIFAIAQNKDMPHLKDVIAGNVKIGVYDKEILKKYDANEIDTINDFIKHDRDFNFAYAGIQQMVDKYLLKDRKSGKIYETPQYAFAVIAMVLFSDYTGQRRIDYVRRFYNAVSLFKISLPTPIMCGVRTPNRQYSSCTLIDVGDSLESIFSSNTAVGYYTSKRAGMGLNFGRIRALGSKIRGGEVIHTGLIPYMRMFEATSKSCTQNGIRTGAVTSHYPFFHLEIEDLLVLKNNKGNEDNRIRKMDYSVQLCRLFYKRIIEDGDITLFSPHDVEDMYEAFGLDNDLFEKLYAEYENSKVKKKKIKARELFTKICTERIETGRLYIMNIDHCNTHSSFLEKNSMSNLCQEITLITKPINHIDDEEGEIALCVLSAINLGEIKELNEMEDLCDLTVRALDYIVENQDYPVKAALKMKKRRSIGIGITNFAYYLAKNKVGYDSTAYELVHKTAEYFQYYCLKASNELAKEFGKCEWYDKTKYSQGILPIDTYNKNVDNLIPNKLELDWEGLRENIKQFGIRNSTLTAIMPCESSSATTNSTNGIEPPRALISSKKSKQGILKTVVPEIGKIGHHYTLAWDVNNKGYMSLVAILQKFLDQSISSNNYYDPSKYEEGNLPISEVMEDILYAYQYGIKTLYYANTNDGKTDEDSGCAGGGCSV
jgi:ribonucleoside-diphosphate reductase alpha chain